MSRADPIARAFDILSARLKKRGRIQAASAKEVGGMGGMLYAAEAASLWIVAEELAFTAQAIEARSGETEGLDPKDESAVPERNAP